MRGKPASSAEIISCPSPEGWVREFLDDNADLAEDLSKAKIYDEAGYLENEGALPDPVREKIGTYRFDRLSRNLNDPCAIARAAPPWLSARTMDRIGLTLPATKVFADHGITKVGDLANWSLTELLRLPNCRRITLRDLCKGLQRAMQEGPIESRLTRLDEDERLDLLTIIRRSLSTLRDRDRDVVLRRMGYPGKSGFLKEMADEYGITKERVRQIELKAGRKLVGEGAWAELLNNKIEAKLSHRQMPLSVKEMESADSWFDGISENLEVLRYVLENINNNAFHVVIIEDVSYLARISQYQWEAASLEALRLLRSGAGKGWLESTCRSLVGNLLPEGSSELRPLLWAKASVLAHLVPEADGRNVLASYGRGLAHTVAAVLTESEVPLHYSTISVLASDRMGHSIHTRCALRAAASVGHLFGSGVYGVDRHLPKPKILQTISDEAEDIVASGSEGRQWHASEILTAIIDRGSLGGYEDAVDKYIVDIALGRARGLKQLGRMTWTGSEANYDAARIELRREIVSVLEKAGRPLQTDEFLKRLMERRGVAGSFRISTFDPVLRIGVGLWGLNDRDLSIKRPYQCLMLDSLVAFLKERGAGILVWELERSNLLAASGLSAEALFSLARGDSRLKISSTEYLYLVEWGGPRRQGISEAIAAVASSSTQPLVLADIHFQVQKRLGRTCAGRSIINGLRAIKAGAGPSSKA